MSDTTFGHWLLRQHGRRDPVGQLAQVAQRDPHWSPAFAVSDARVHLMQLGTRPFVLQTLRQAESEFDWQRARAAADAARKRSRKRARAARRHNRK